VQTTHGKVQGKLLKGIYEDPFYAFDGIPYAVPPLGTLRFKERNCWTRPGETGFRY